MAERYKISDIDQDDWSGFAMEPQNDLWFNNGEEERSEEGTLRILSLFSGCGGMDLGLEGGFICHRKSDN